MIKNIHIYFSITWLLIMVIINIVLISVVLEIAITGTNYFSHNLCDIKYNTTIIYKEYKRGK